MATIRAFRALRPVPEKALEVSSVPYDVVDTIRARKLSEGNPLSFLHVIRPEIDLPDGIDPHEDAVYEQALKNFNTLLNKSVLIKDEAPKLYIYRICMDSHTQYGIAGLCSVDEYDRGIIKKHEHTRKDKVDDRVRHMLTISAHSGPVLMTYRGLPSIEAIINREIQRSPLYDFVCEDRTQHTVWEIDIYKDLIKAFQAVEYIYIADGHHRAAGASCVNQEMTRKRGASSGNNEFNYFLSVLFPAEQLKILSYNRYVCDLHGLNTEEFLNELRGQFRVKADGDHEPSGKGQFSMFLHGRWYSLTLQKTEREASDPVSLLDLTIFQKKLLEPILGIKDQKKDTRIEFVGGLDSSTRLEKLVNDRGGVGFTFYPVGIDELLSVADRGMIMPPKSTWFAPKLRSGLLIHQF